MRYQYQYVPLRLGGGWMSDIVCEHHEIIDRHAQEGWRYVGFVPIELFGGSGAIKRIELIFEKPVEE